MQRDIAGLYFLTFTKPPVNLLHWQGRVLSQPNPGWFLVQLYDWIVGEPNDIRLVRIEDMATWFFYLNAEDWREQAAEYSKPV